MKKNTMKRLGLGLLQHLCAGGILLAIAAILFNSCLAVDTIHGTRFYRIDPFHADPEFEDSVLFQDLFQTAVEDVTSLVVVKGQLETDGELDLDKRIDVTQYANRMGTGNACNTTAVYTLENLIKWGRRGIEYKNRSMSMSDFVNYFEDAVSPYNFDVDASGRLRFIGYNEGYYTGEKVIPEDSDLNLKSQEELQAVEKTMGNYTKEQLEDMAYSYILSDVPDEITISREDDGTLYIYVSMLICQYDMADGERQLYKKADNWADYLALQENVAESAKSLALSYEQYQNSNELYTEGNSNLKYVVRVMTEDGIKTYTNMPELENYDDNAITDYYTNYRRYVIYYPDSLGFMGSGNITENDIYQYMSEYEYAYPETTHVWIGVDTSYAVKGDALYNANTLYQRIVPNVAKFVALIALLSVLWLILAAYLTATAGVICDEEGERQKYLTRFDRIWTELLLLGVVLSFYILRYGKEYLNLVAEDVYISNTENAGIAFYHFGEYGIFAGFGADFSLWVCLLWYSLIRRIRSHSIWKGSFLHDLYRFLGRVSRFVLSHRNSVVSSLLPYNLFLLFNLIGIYGFYRCIFALSLWTIPVAILVIVCDGIVGVLLFRRNAEQVDIVEGIRRIRDGEVDYKLDADSMHGSCRDLADAVNNIGEGIKKAVHTSMRDEQMKTDLITNVSHDIKTPLTSIVSYVDLLKRLKITDEPAKSYIEILDSKSQRLKLLTDDLVEASKISSGNIVLNMEKLNLTELLNQGIGEFCERFEEKKLSVVFESARTEANIYADSRRMWRIIENLFQNICKYALEGTRVYIDVACRNGSVEASFKNISEQQMNIGAEELTERFIRGDESRSTEGSGLGLYISKSLTRAQGGSMEIRLDGDLFKVILTFKEYEEESVENREVAQEEQEM